MTHEREDPWELARIEEGAVLGANVDDDSASRAEIFSVHQIGTDRARSVTELAFERIAARHDSGVGSSMPEPFALLQQGAQELVTDELSAASVARKQIAEACPEARERQRTIWAPRVTSFRIEDEPELVAAASAVQVPVEVQMIASCAT
jgi:hypothetical protein